MLNRKTAETNQLSQNLKLLMSKSKISSGTSLAIQIGLPPQTINRILSGSVSDPKSSTLTKISIFFNITIDQLLYNLNINENVQQYQEHLSPSTVPVISWKQIPGFVFENKTINVYSHKNWISSEKKLSSGSFAVVSKPFMSPRFKTNSTLIVDVGQQPVDGQYVFVLNQASELTIRKFIHDGINVMLKDMFLDNSITEKIDGFRIVGVIVESRFDT